MPRRKIETVDTGKNPDVVSVTIDFPPETYAQVERAAQAWGYTVREWLDEAIQNQL